jgi:hypothetical protein
MELREVDKKNSGANETTDTDPLEHVRKLLKIDMFCYWFQ